MLMKSSVAIAPSTTSPELFLSLAEVGADLMVKTLAGLEAGTITPQEQDDSQATLAPILTRDDARIDFTRMAQDIDQRFRGFQPWPGAFTMLRGKKLIVHAMTYDPLTAGFAEPGAIDLQDGRFRVTCGGGGTLLFNEVQMEGKKRMAAEEFLRGFQVKAGEVLGKVNA